MWRYGTSPIGRTRATANGSSRVCSRASFATACTCRRNSTRTALRNGCAALWASAHQQRHQPADEAERTEDADERAEAGLKLRVLVGSSRLSHDLEPRITSSNLAHDVP